MLLESQSHRASQTPSEQINSGLKRLRLSEDEYVEKLLMDFGYQNDIIPENLPKIHKKIPINDQRIHVKLHNPKAHITRDSYPTFLASQDAYAFAYKAQSLMTIPSVINVENQGLQTAKDPSKTQQKTLDRIGELIQETGISFTNVYIIKDIKD